MARLIDADKLKAHYAWWGNDGAEYRERKADFDVIVDLQPTVDPVKHGRWLPYEFATNKRWRKCSVCGTADEYINEFGLVAIRNYCPNCGAKMDNPQTYTIKAGEV